MQVSKPDKGSVGNDRFTRKQKVLVELENIVKSKAQVDLSRIASKVDSTLRPEHIYRQLGKERVVIAHQKKLKRMKKHSPSTYPTQWEVDIEYTFSKFTFSDSNSSGPEDRRC